MKARREFIFGLSLILSGSSPAQVVAPVEIADPVLRSMQQRSMPQLKQVATNITAHRFDHDFYCTRKLDVDESKQRQSDQHSIRFEHYEGGTVLAISGSYYGAYPEAHFSREERARRTFYSVVLPLAKASVPAFQSDETIQGFAFEVSHHVIGKAMGMSMERPENMMVYLPRAAAIKLVSAGVGADGRATQQAALLDSEVFLNASPLSLWLSDEGAPSRVEVENLRPATLNPAVETTVAKQPPEKTFPEAPMPPTAVSTSVPPSEPITLAAKISAPAEIHEAAAPLPTVHLRDTSPANLAALQAANQGISDRLVRELDKQAHFVAFAPPTFITFRQQIYLELSVSTLLAEGPGTSRYKLAALAFDDHISPLIRRVLLYYQDHHEFDGISFSTTVHTRSKTAGAHGEAISIEFFFPLSASRSYEAYDVTGQQLLNSGIVLINGERVQLDLQQAEASDRP